MKKILSLLLFLFCFTKSFSETFNVTNNGDSGAGSFREALTRAAANGGNETDYINFSLTGSTQESHTITLQTQLPNVTSNLIIDGSTEPGKALSVNGAKIILTTADGVTGINCFNFDFSAVSVQIYGFCITGFLANQKGGGIAIQTAYFEDVIIGARGKGNVFCLDNEGITGQPNSFTLQNNIMGLMPDGETLASNINNLDIEAHNIVIGGDDPSMGNVFAHSGNNSGGESVFANTVTVKNNLFGTDYTGKSSYNVISGFFLNFKNYSGMSAQIIGNIFSAGDVEPVVVGGTYNTVIIKGNYFGCDKTQTHFFNYGGTAITGGGTNTIVVGGDEDADQNIITHYNVAIKSVSSSQFAIIKNQFYCDNSVAFNGSTNASFIFITKLTSSEVSGVTSPGAMVQLYSTIQQCNTCNPNKCFATITADANGNWDYIGAVSGNVLATFTLQGNTTGPYPSSGPLLPGEIEVTNVTCNQLGKLKFTYPREGFQIIWQDSKGNTVGTGQEADDLKGGIYTVTISENGGCPSEFGKITVYDETTILKVNNVTPVCTGLYHYTPNIITANGVSVTYYQWTNEKGEIISNSPSADLPAGNYTLTIRDSNDCTYTGVFSVYQGVYPSLDDSRATTTDADCGQNNGSIKGLVVKNTANQLNAGWYRYNSSEYMGSNPDLLNAPPGQYNYVINYSNNCSALVSRVFTIGNKQNILIDETNVKITPSGCHAGGGSVTGIKVTGATFYLWVDGNNNIVGTSLDLLNVPAGTYVLTASDGKNCGSKASLPYTVQQLPPTVYPDYPCIIVNSCKSIPTGAISITPDDLVSGLRWVDAFGKDKGIGATINALPAGTYSLYFTDKYGCESFYKSYTINNLTELTIQPNSQQITNDNCNLQQGSVTGIIVNGGLPPYTYKWTNDHNNIVSNTADLVNIPAGNYNFMVTDISGCGKITAQYLVSDDDFTIPAPLVDDIQLCSSGNTTIMVKDAQANAIYNLYDDLNGTKPVMQIQGGKFKINVNVSTIYYISQLYGSCESERKKVNITVGLSASNIANTFTPNGDGINDYWNIANIENYPQALIQVFTREGQKVFESRGYSVPFDGTYKGHKLPAGVYFFVIDLRGGCNLLSGNLTIIN